MVLVFKVWPLPFRFLMDFRCNKVDNKIQSFSPFKWECSIILVALAIAWEWQLHNVHLKKRLDAVKLKHNFTAKHRSHSLIHTLSVAFRHLHVVSQCLEFEFDLINFTV